MTAPLPAPSIIRPMIERAGTDLPVADHVHGSAETLGQRDELGGGAGVQPALVEHW